MSVLSYPSVPCLPIVLCTRLCSVAVLRHHGVTMLCIHLPRCVRCRPRRPLNLALLLSVLSRWSPWLLLRTLGLSAQGHSLPCLLLHPRLPLWFLPIRSFALAVGLMVAPTLLTARGALMRSAPALDYPPLPCGFRCPLRLSRSALPAPPLPRGTLPAHLLPPVARTPFTSASCPHPGTRLQPVSPSSVHFPPVGAPAPKAGVALSTAGRVHSAMCALSARWVAILSALASASALFVDCQASSNPEAHMTRSIAKFAPSTLERYLDQWSSWSRHCELAGFHPSSPPPGFLPDWIASRASAQGLATAPLKALAWMCETAGLPALRDALSSPLCRAFAVASAPSEHRESLPLSLSFVVWLEQSVLDPGTSPAQVLRLGFVLVCVWASLRWGHSIWVPPARLQYQLSVQALVGVSVRTKTTKRGMPWGLLAHGFLGSPASSWALRFLSCLRQAVSDTLALQPSRTLDFLPAVLSGSESRPLISEPWDRDRFVPWLRDLLCQHWSLNSREPLPPVFSLIAAQSLKATMLSWARQLSIESDARRIQGHHRLSGADRSVALYSRDDIIPMVRLQARVVAAFRNGFRPLQPVARGLVAPLDDFPVVLPSGSLPSLDLAALPPDCLPDVPVPPPVTSPPAPTDPPPPLPAQPDPSATASEDDLVSLSSEESEAPQIRMRSRIGKQTWWKRLLSKPLPLHLGLFIIRAAMLCTSLRLAPPTLSGPSVCFGKMALQCMSVRPVVRRLAR